MKKGFLLFLLMISQRAVWGQSSGKIQQIDIYSDSALDIPRVLDLFNIKKNANYSQIETEEGLARLAETGLFQNISSKYDEDTQKLSLYLMVQNRIKDIEIFIEGELSRGLRAQLQTEIADSLNVAKDDAIRLDSLAELRSRIYSRLRDRGYSKNQVLILLEERSPGPERILVVRSNLGPRDEIKELVLEGVSDSDANELSKLLDLRSDITRWANVLGLPIGKQFPNGKAIPVSKPLDSIFINEVLSKWNKSVREKGFYDLKVTSNYSLLPGGAYQLKISLTKGQRYNIQFKNAVAFWEKTLRQSIVEKSLRTETSINLKEAQEILKKLYLAKGFKDFRVKVSSEDLSTARNVIFELQEGKQYYLRNVRALNVPEEFEKDIQLGMDAWRQSLMHPFHKIYWDEDYLKVQLAELIKELRRRGFLTIRILDFNFTPVAKSNFFDVQLDLQTGSRFVWKSVSVSGNSFFREKELNKIVTAQPGDWANPDLINQISVDLIDLYHDSGFLYAEAKWSEEELLKKAGTSNELELDINLNPGPQIMVGKVIIESSGRTKEGVVLREVNKNTIKQGGLWSQSGQDRLEQNLAALGIFGQARISPVGGRTLRTEEKNMALEQQEKDLKISLTDRPGGAFEFGPGYRTDDGLIGVAEFNYRNLGGWNRSILLRSQVSAKLENYQFLEQRYNIAYMEPWLADLPLRLRANVGYSKLDETVFFRGRAVSGYNYEESTYGLGLDTALSEKLHWYHNLYSFSQPRVFGLLDNTEASKIPDRTKIATVGSTLIYENRNNIFNPTKGFMTTSGIEYGGPVLGGDQDAHFWILRQDFYAYAPLGSRLVAAFALNYAKIWGIGSSQGIPLTKRLTLGGRTTLRALSQGALRNDARGVKLQDSLLVRSEMRFPLFLGIGFAYFVDMGQIDSHGYGYSGWRIGPGIGFRYQTPVGPISLDIAHNLNKREDEENLKLQISIGTF